MRDEDATHASPKHILPLRPLKKLLSKHYILNVEDLLVHTYALCRLLLNRGAIALFAIKAFAA